MRKAAKEKTIRYLAMLALAGIVCAPSLASASVFNIRSTASSETVLASKNRVEIFLHEGQIHVEQSPFDTVKRDESGNPEWGVALECSIAPKVADDVDDFIIPGQKWYHGTDVDSADDIINNGLNRKKLLGSDPVEGADTPGFFVTDKLSDAQDYARLRGGERGKAGSILEWDDTEIGRFLEGVGKNNEAVIPFDAFDKVPRPRPGG